MSSNIAVVITAETTDLAAKFAIARSQSSALTAELNRLAKQAATTGVGAELQPQLIQASEAMLTAKNRANELGAALKKVGDDSGSGMNNLRHELLGLVDPIRGVYNGVGEMAEAFAALYVAHGATDLIERTNEFGSGLLKLSEQTGVSTETLSAWQYAAGQSGVSAESLNSGILKLGKSVQEALTVPTSIAAEAFNAMGISQDFLRDNSNNLEAVLMKIADAFHSHAAGAQADAIAMAVLSRGGAEMIPFLQQGSDGIAQMTARAQELGITISGPMAEAMDKQVRATKDMEAAWQGVLNRISGPVDDFLTMMAHGIEQDITWIEKLVTAIKSVPSHMQRLMGAGSLPFAGPDTQAIGGAHGSDSTGLSGFPMPSANTQQFGNLANPSAANKEAEDARRIADEQTQIWEQASAKRIEGEQSANASLLALGNESLDQFTALAKRLEDARYETALGGLQAREQIDKGDAVALAKDLADAEVLQVEHNNKLAEIDQQYALKSLEAQRRADDQASAQRQAAFATELAARKQQSTLEIQQIEETNRGIQAAHQQEVQTARTTMGEIGGIENTFVRNMLSGRMNLSQMVGSLALQMAEKEIAADLKSLTAHLLFNDEQLGADQAKYAEGWLTQKLFGGMAVTADAKLAAAGAYASASQVPYIGWLLGPVAAVAAFAGTEAFGSFAVGSWSVPQDMTANIHQGEMIIPAAQAQQIRDGSSGGNNVTLQVTVNSLDPRQALQVFKDNAASLAQVVSSHMRLNPSTRPGY